MKPALPVLLCLVSLVAVAGCSHSDEQETRPTSAPTVTTSAAPTASTGATPTRTAAPTAAALVGPAGTRVPKGFAPQSATFISDTTGWVLGESPCPSGKGACDVIARTRDAGASWRAIPSPKTSPDRLAQIRFANARDGFVTGDQLWATHDGGATWGVVPGIGDVNGIAAGSGRVWINKAGALRSAPVGGGAFVTERATSVSTFVLQGSTVVAGSEADAQLRVGTHGGGFTTRTTPCAREERAIPGAGSGVWLLVCAGDAGLGHEDKRAYRSTDAGRTWTGIAAPPPLTGTELYATSDGDFLVDHQQVSAYRGGSWSTSLDTSGGLSEGGFESARMGYVIGGFGSNAEPAMRVTHDAGRTWRDAAFRAAS